MPTYITLLVVTQSWRFPIKVVCRVFLWYRTKGRRGRKEGGEGGKGETGTKLKVSWSSLIT